MNALIAYASSSSEDDEEAGPPHWDLSSCSPPAPQVQQQTTPPNAGELWKDSKLALETPPQSGLEASVESIPSGDSYVGENNALDIQTATVKGPVSLEMGSKSTYFDTDCEMSRGKEQTYSKGGVCAGDAEGNSEGGEPGNSLDGGRKVCPEEGTVEEGHFIGRDVEVGLAESADEGNQSDVELGHSEIMIAQEGDTADEEYEDVELEYTDVVVEKRSLVGGSTAGVERMDHSEAGESIRQEYSIEEKDGERSELESAKLSETIGEDSGEDTISEVQAQEHSVEEVESYVDDEDAEISEQWWPSGSRNAGDMTRNVQNETSVPRFPSQPDVYSRRHGLAAQKAPNPGSPAMAPPPPSNEVLAPPPPPDEIPPPGDEMPTLSSVSTDHVTQPAVGERDVAVVGGGATESQPSDKATSKLTSTEYGLTEMPHPPDVAADDTDDTTGSKMDEAMSQPTSSESEVPVMPHPPSGAEGSSDNPQGYYSQGDEVVYKEGDYYSGEQYYEEGMYAYQDGAYYEQYGSQDQQYSSTDQDQFTEPPAEIQEQQNSSGKDQQYVSTGAQDGQTSSETQEQQNAEEQEQLYVAQERTHAEGHDQQYVSAKTQEQGLDQQYVAVQDQQYDHQQYPEGGAQEYYEGQEYTKGSQDQQYASTEEQQYYESSDQYYSGYGQDYYTDSQQYDQQSYEQYQYSQDPSYSQEQPLPQQQQQQQHEYAQEQLAYSGDQQYPPDQRYMTTSEHYSQEQPTYSPDPNQPQYTQDPSQMQYLPDPNQPYPPDPNQPQYPPDPSQSQYPPAQDPQYPPAIPDQPHQSGSERGYFHGNFERRPLRGSHHYPREGEGGYSSPGSSRGHSDYGYGYHGSRHDRDAWRDRREREQRAHDRDRYDLHRRPVSNNYRDSPPARDTMSPSRGYADGRSGGPMRDPRVRKSGSSPSGDPKVKSEESSSSKNKHYTKSAKYAAVNTNFMQKTTPLLKQSSSRNKTKDRKGPQLVQPHSAPESPSKKKKTDKPKPPCFPGEASGSKKSLSGFKIPKRKSAAVEPKPSSPTVKIPALDISEDKSAELERTTEGKGEPESAKLQPEKLQAEKPKAEKPAEEGSKPASTAAPTLQSVNLSFKATTKPGEFVLVPTLTSSSVPTPIPVPAQDLAKLAPIAKSNESSSNKAIPLVTPPQVIASDLFGTTFAGSLSGQDKIAALVSAKNPKPAASASPEPASKTTKPRRGKGLQQTAPSKKDSSPAPAAKKSKDLTSMLKNLNPTVLQTLAATIQRTLESADKKKSLPVTTGQSTPTTTTSTAQKTTPLAQQKQSLVARLKSASPAPPPQPVVSITPIIKFPTSSSTTDRRLGGSTSQSGIVLATIVPTTETKSTTSVSRHLSAVSSQSPSEEERAKGDDSESMRKLKKDGTAEKRDQKTDMGSEHGSNVTDRNEETSIGDGGLNITTSKGTDSTSVHTKPSSAIANVTSMLPQLEGIEDDSKSGVFMDENFHVLYKEYNLRRSKTFLTAIKPLKKELSSEPKAAVNNEQTKTAEKRQGSFEVSSEAKRFKATEDVLKELSEKEADVVMVKPSSPVKTSPGKRGRKPSLSQSKKLHRKRQATGSKESQSNIVCCLCSKRDSSSNLGFLYGPYKPVAEKTTNQEAATPAVGGGDVVVDQPAWVHEDCAVWAPGVCIVRGKLLGLHEAIADGKTLSCRYCKSAGATLCCSARACKAVFHFPCARDAGCSFKEEQFVIACPKHKLPS